MRRVSLRTVGTQAERGADAAAYRPGDLFFQELDRTFDVRVDRSLDEVNYLLRLTNRSVAVVAPERRRLVDRELVDHGARSRVVLGGDRSFVTHHARVILFHHGPFR